MNSRRAERPGKLRTDHLAWPVRQVELNILVLVNDLDVKRPVEVYRYFLENGWFYHQYISCVEVDARGRPLPASAYKDVGRNDPCPCGSGKKFKKYCLGRLA